MKKRYFFLGLTFLAKLGWGQTIIFSENIGSPGATTVVNSYTGWQNAAPVSFTSTSIPQSDVRTSVASSGYTGSSGSGNVFITITGGINFIISGINTTGYTGITLSLGHFKSTIGGNNELTIDVSPDGTNYTPLTYTRPTGSGTANWILLSPTGTIPATANLRIRFTQTSTTTQFRIDDIKLEGTLAGGTPDITLSSPSPAVAAGNMTLGSTNNIVYRFDLAVATATANLTGVTINTSGSYIAADLTSLKCWYSDDAVFDAGTDQILSTKITGLAPGTQVFPSFSPQGISDGSTGYLFITSDMSCGAMPGNLLVVDAITTADISFSSGNKTGTAAAGDGQTVITSSPNNVTAPAASSGNSQSALSWTNPSGCYSEIMILAAAGTSNTGIPSGDGSAYAASLIFGSGSALGNGFVVYKGAASPEIVTALTNGATYYFKFFTRNGSNWSSGIEVSATPAAPVIITYTWSGGNGLWTNAANWTPNRNSPDVTDILQFNNGAAQTVTGVPAETIGKLLITNNTSVALQPGMASTLTIAGGTGTDLVLESGSSLNSDGSSALTIFVGTGATATINGNMSFSGAPHKLDASDANAISMLSPAIITQGTGCTGNLFTNSGTASVVVFGTGTSFVQNAGSNPFGLGAPNSKVIFQQGSLFKMQQNIALALTGRNYANLEINFPAYAQSTTGGSLLKMDDLTITAGSINLNLTGGIHIKGNISVATGATLGFLPASAATLTLNGSSAQSISNNGNLNFGPNVSLEIDNANGVTLNSSLTLGIAGVLTLTNGLLSIGNNDLILTNNDAMGAIGAYSTNSYVATNGTGHLQRAVSGAGNYIFPVGKTSAIEEASISFATPLGAANTLAARFHSGFGGNSGLPLSESGENITRSSVIGYWEINAGSPVAATYTGTFVARNFTDVTDYSKLHLIKRADGSSPWLLDGTHVPATGSNLLVTLQRTGLSGFSQFGVGGSAAEIGLPVTFASFSGYREGSRNQLRWTTASEQNNLGFDVQRSADGINYQSIGFVSSLALNGNSSDLLNYSFTDFSPLSERKYYRLRQVDLNSTSRLSHVILIRDGKPFQVNIESVFPNPALDQLQIFIGAPATCILNIQVHDMSGRQLQQQIIRVQTGSNTVPLFVGGLQKGTYLLRAITTDGQVSVTRFVKQ